MGLVQWGHKSHLVLSFGTQAHYRLVKHSTVSTHKISGASNAFELSSWDRVKMENLNLIALGHKIHYVFVTANALCWYPQDR